MRISREPTDSFIPARPAAGAQDADASIGQGIADLAEQLASAQNALSTSLIALRSSGSADPNLIAQGDAQLGTLLALKRQLSLAGPGALAAIRAEIAACVASASSVSREADAAVAVSSGPAANVAAASQVARASVTSFLNDYYREKKFDAYLHFTSEQDEEEFRHREAERKGEIERALALHTPEGDLRAITLSKEQLKDAGLHGAVASPDFKPDMDSLNGAEAQLTSALAAESPAKATKTAKIELDPLDAIKPSLEASRDEIAKLKSAGVIVAEQGHGHGVNADASRQIGAQRSAT